MSGDKTREADARPLDDMGEVNRGEVELTPRERSNQNLILWKPGQSGNPGGRPKGSGVTDRLRTILSQGDNGKDVAEALVQAALKAAKNGDFRFWKEIVDRVDGPVKQQIEASLVMFAKAIDRSAFDGA